MAHRPVAVVTGASQGIGQAIALRLAKDGFDIAVNDLTSRKDALEQLVSEIEQKGVRACVCIADVSVEAEVKGMFENVVDKLGGIDVMVANAGIIKTVKLLIETTLEDWEQIMNTNARGTFLCYRFAALQMIKQGRGGRIIGASSVAGKQGTATASGYCASKFAIRGLTQAVAIELGKYGITVNAYAPGAIETPMTNAIGDLVGNRAEFFAGEALKTAVGHIGQPQDIASIVSYLASKEAHFITGQSISVNGGVFFD